MGVECKLCTCIIQTGLSITYSVRNHIYLFFIVSITPHGFLSMLSNVAGEAKRKSHMKAGLLQEPYQGASRSQEDISLADLVTTTLGGAEHDRVQAAINKVRKNEAGLQTWGILLQVRQTFKQYKHCKPQVPELSRVQGESLE